jgi:hypothetical protein
MQMPVDACYRHGACMQMRTTSCHIVAHSLGERACTYLPTGNEQRHKCPQHYIHASFLCQAFVGNCLTKGPFLSDGIRG